MDNFEQWVEEYQPIINDNGEQNSYDNLMYETYPPDIDIVKSYDNNQVWTLIEVEDKRYLIPGFHVVNRLGYFLTSNIWTNVEQEILID